MKEGYAMEGLAALLLKLRALLTLLVIMDASQAAAVEKAKGASEGIDCAGKVLLVRLKGPEQSVGLIENVRKKKLDGRTFLVGQSADDGKGSNPVAGVTVWLACDEIAQIWEFRTVQEALDAFAKQRAPASSSQPEKGSEIPGPSYAPEGLRKH
jgi:hypothetical protein